MSSKEHIGRNGLKLQFSDFSEIDNANFITATVVIAFGRIDHIDVLAIGIGTMVTYASYFKPDTNLRHTALNVTILDTLVAILAGVVIFPAVFSVGIEPSSGPSLVFITLPSIFNGMPLSMVWSSIFFLLLVVAALTSTISLHEVVTVYLHEEWHLSRKAAAWLTTAATAPATVISRCGGCPCSAQPARSSSTAESTSSPGFPEERGQAAGTGVGVTFGRDGGAGASSG